MKIQVVDDQQASYGRIQEVVDGQEVATCFICDHPASDDEGNGIRYCCKAHKELHISSDQQGEAYPFVVNYRAEVGRYMVAARDIQPGEVIFSEEPLAVGPNHTTLPCCLDCMKLLEEDGYRCPNCNLPVCEEMCAYGEEHAKECSVFSALDEKLTVENYDVPNPLYWCITVLRALSLRDSDPTKYAIIARMMDHNVEHAKKEATWAAYMEHVVIFLRHRCGLADKYSEEEILHVLGSLDVNSLKIHSGTVGHGLYGLTALMSHSCISNSKTVLNEDYSNVCRATIAILKGEEITKQYVNPLETTMLRRQRLREGWYFDCRCARCIDPTEAETFSSATRCLRCGHGTILPANPLSEDEASVWKCNTCPFSTTLSAVDKLVAYFTEKVTNPVVVGSVEALEDLLEKSARLLHPSHYVVTLMRIRMNVAYIQLADRMFGEGGESEEQPVPMEVYMRRKELLDEIHKIVEVVDPGLTRRRGLSLFEMSTCHLQLGRLLYESGRFPLDDFLQLLSTEIASLEEAIQCLEDSREGTKEAMIHYRAQCALHEAEVMQRLVGKQQQMIVTNKSSTAADAVVEAEVVVEEDQRPSTNDQQQQQQQQQSTAKSRSSCSSGGMQQDDEAKSSGQKKVTKKKKAKK